jgi:signal transduction histidine kinase
LTVAGIESREQGLLILAPTERDAVLAQSVLQRAGVACTRCADLNEVCDNLAAGAGAVLLPEEAVALDRSKRLRDWLNQQPIWSDLPVLILARAGADSAVVAEAMDQLGNVTVLERPIRVAALVSAVRTALRARQRQYQARAQLARIEQSEHDLREAHIRKDEFLAILAHELRNPLAPLRNSLHILRLTNRDE